MIKAQNLTKKYGEYLVIDNISLTVKDNDFIGIVGEAGSGKTTLLYLLSGLLKATSGSVLFDDMELTRADDKTLSRIRRKSIGFVFQFHNLISGLSVQENMEVPLVLVNKNPVKYSKRIAELLKQVGLSGYEKRDVSELSGGQQQRVAIARALINNPKVIFADEPTGNLDSKNTDIVIELLKKIHQERNVSIVMVTHSNRTLKYCNKIIRISDGRIVE